MSFLSTKNFEKELEELELQVKTKPKNYYPYKFQVLPTEENYKKIDIKEFLTRLNTDKKLDNFTYITENIDDIEIDKLIFDWILFKFKPQQKDKENQNMDLLTKVGFFLYLFDSWWYHCFYKENFTETTNNTNNIDQTYGSHKLFIPLFCLISIEQLLKPKRFNSFLTKIKDKTDSEIKHEFFELTLITEEESKHIVAGMRQKFMAFLLKTHITPAKLDIFFNILVQEDRLDAKLNKDVDQLDRITKNMKQVLNLNQITRYTITEYSILEKKPLKLYKDDQKPECLTRYNLLIYFTRKHISLPQTRYMDLYCKYYINFVYQGVTKETAKYLPMDHLTYYLAHFVLNPPGFYAIPERFLKETHEGQQYFAQIEDILKIVRQRKEKK